MSAGTKVVMGVIDDGIAFANDRFIRKGAGTRVEYWWLQDGRYRGQPADFEYGHELSKAEIDNLLRNPRAGVVNEDLLYAQAGLIDYTRRGHKAAAWRSAHGTHVLDVMAGADAATVADERPIVAVQLPTRVTADTSGADLVAFAYDAMEYIVSRAERLLNPPFSVVINLSYGKIAGPHDGTSELEWGIDQLVRDCETRRIKLRVVLPAGNNHLLRCHAAMTFTAGAKVALNWRVLPDDRTPSFLEIWMPFRRGGGDPRRVKVTVTPPGGAPKTIEEKRGAYASWAIGNSIYAEMSYTHQPHPTQRGFFFIALQPTARLRRSTQQAPYALAPAGSWTVEIENLQLTPREIVHAWIQRDDSVQGYRRRGRQSYFDDRRYDRYDHAGRDVESDNYVRPVPRTRAPGASAISREGTLNAIATGSKLDVIGGIVRKTSLIDDGSGALRHEMLAAKYSASGPITPPRDTIIVTRDGPSAALASEDSKVHVGVLAAGTRSGSTVAMGGTSVAAPQIARWIADEFAAGRPGDVEALAASQEPFPPNDPRRPPRIRYGAGRIELQPAKPGVLEDLVPRPRGIAKTS